MKVLDAQVGMLSNYEVLAHLTGMKEKYTEAHLKHGAAHAMKAENLETVMKETREYLEGTACALQTEAHIDALVDALAKYQLEKVELLNIINERPSGIAELDCVVEELDQRYNEEQIQDMLGIIKTTLPEPPKTSEENAAN